MNPIVFKQISTFPGQRRMTSSRKRATFRCGYNDTIKLLEKELSHLKAQRITIYADVMSDRDIRNDGMIRSDARMRSPAIILSFESKAGPLTYAADLYTDWVDNLRGIALTLESLRAGWKQLPPAASTTTFQSANEAATFIRVRAQWGDIAMIINDAAERQHAYRLAAKACHPDIHGAGRTQEFSMLNLAKEYLDGGGK